MNLRFILKKSFKIGVYDIGAVILRFVNVAVFTHFLTPTHLGHFTLARSIVFLAGIYSLFGLSQGILRQGSIALGQGKNLIYDNIKNYGFSLSFLFSLILGLIGLIFSDIIAKDIFHDKELSSYLLAFSFIVPIMNVNFLFQVLLQVKHRSDVAQLISNLVYTIFILVSFLFFTLFIEGKVLVINSYLVAHLFYLILLLKYIKEEKVFFTLSLEKNEKKKLFQISLPMFFAATINQSQKWIDTFLLGVFGNAASVGIYFVGLRIASFIDIPLSAFNTVFMPIAGRMFGKGDKDELNNLYKSVTKIMFISGSLIFIALYYFRNEIVSILGKEYNNSSNVIIYILLGELVNIGVGATRKLITMCGGAKINLINSIISLTLLVVLSIIFIPLYDIIGAAVAHALAVGLLNIISVLELKILFKLSPFDLRYLNMIISFAAVFILIIVINTNSLLFFVTIIIIYLLIIGIFGITKTEKNRIIDIIGKKFNI